MRRASIYCRLSYDREGAGLGVQRQEQDCRELAASLGWEVAGVHIDNDVSAYSGRRRPGYERLLADIENGIADAVLAWHTDRLHRSVVELERFIEVVDGHHTEVRTVRGGELDLATPTGRLIARQLGSIARYESEHRGERVARARAQKAAAGRFTGGSRAFGWGPDGVTLIPQEATEVLRAAEALLGGVTLKAITADLRARGVAPVRAKDWTPSTLRDVLLKPRNAGISVYRGEEVGRGAWPPILPEDTWRAVVARLRDPTRTTSPGPTPRWLGSGLYRCGIAGCDGLMRASTAGSHKHRPAYRCKKQAHLVRSAPQLDDYVETVIVERLSRPDARDLLLRRTEVDTGALHAEAATLAERMEQLSAAFADGDITAAQLRSGSERLRLRLAEVNGHIAAAAQVDPLAPLVGAQNVRSAWDQLALGRRRAILDALLIVTVLPAQHRGPGLDPGSISTEWRR